MSELESAKITKLNQVVVSAELQPVKPVGIIGSIINTMRLLVGAGMLVIPWSVAQGSLVPSIFVIIFSGIYSLLTCIMITKACELTNQFEYSSLLKYVGKKWELLSGIVLIYAGSSQCLGYCIITGDFLSYFFLDLNINTKYLREYCIIFSTICVFLPLCLLKQLNSLKYSSFFGIIAMLYVAILLIYKSMKSSDNPLFIPGQYNDHSSSFNVFNINMGLFIVSNVCCKAFDAPFGIPNVYESLHKRSLTRMYIVLFITYFICICMAVALGICGYYLFGSNINADILSSFGSHHGVLITIARLGMTICLYGNYPLTFKALITTIQIRFLHKYFIKNHCLKNVLIIFLVVLFGVISLFINNIGPIASIEGAIIVLGLIGTFPMLISWTILNKVNNEQELNVISYDTLDMNEQDEFDHDTQISDDDIKNEDIKLKQFQNDKKTQSLEKESSKCFYKLFLCIMLFIGWSLGLLGIFVQIFYY
eukprot:499420_1